jgi:general secretion pathway protein B
MSYILEALRKADAERERGSVPDLHAQLLPPGTAELQVEAPGTSLLPWLAVGVLLAIVAGGAWYVVDRDEPVAVAVAPPPATSVAASAAAAPSASAAAAAVAASAAAVASTPEPAAAPPKPAAKTATKTAAPRSAPPAPAARNTSKRADPAPKAALARVAAPPPKAEASAVRVPALGELPGELRQQVPPLVIGGSVYSPQASARMVIVNGQVFQEGGILAPELKLEQVRQKAAVFSIRGQLFEVPF